MSNCYTTVYLGGYVDIDQIAWLNIIYKPYNEVSLYGKNTNAPYE